MTVLTGITRNPLPTAMLCALASACTAPTQGTFSQIQPGMTAQEVVAHLGQPSSRTAAPADTHAAWAVRWHYGDRPSTLATSALMPDQPPPHGVWTIWFDDEERVIEVATPTRADPPSWRPPPVPPR